MRTRIIEVTVSAVLAGLYYGLIAHPVLFWIVDRLTSSVSLNPGPVLAAIWLVAEILVFLPPFIALGMWATMSETRGIPGAAASLLVFWAPRLILAVGALAFGVTMPAFSGIGGALSTWPGFAADLAASAIGLALVFAGQKSMRRMRRSYA